VSSVKKERELEAVDIRPMNDLDIPMVGTIERAGYQFPWSEGIFRDCLRVGYVCRVVEVGSDMAGYGIMSVGAGEAHVLNVCIRDDYRCRGLARKMLLYLLDRAVEHRRGAAVSLARLRAGRHPPRLLSGGGRPRRRPRAAPRTLRRRETARRPMSAADTDPTREIARRRTFAIISHPDHLHPDTSRHLWSLIRINP
jgi:ribosomal-protein-alanine N-acetyltransferase